ncbi:ATP-dependent DNA helicase [Marinicella gelatinilytica]|uniref:ATP-dependent DNA helicase n=1 Tax=Marinicella gelatinilytica TaxID=2996017 RepID=UPI0022610396|nr:ATP-dependent DNA helicase [Marinicella gelatinilytica]MCX7545267.1 ATP-dependent DNA helicase [Marinicella gelatinilytica]
MDIERVLGEKGLLDTAMDSFQPRQTQLDLAQTIADVISDNKTLIAEAGTGTGKTFAYLVPALLSGKKTIISTGTKNLQDQLFNKDLPFLLSQLKFKKNPTIRLLKGRNNYLCHYRYQQSLHKAVAKYPANKTLYRKLPIWIEQTDSGDLAELSDEFNNNIVQREITSTAENCLGKDCQLYNDCFVYRARNRAMNADILVINHHLLLADMALKEEGYGELLPNAEVIIIDESHQLSGIAERFFSQNITSRQCKDLLVDIKTAVGEVKGGFAAIQDSFFDFEISLKKAQSTMVALDNRRSMEELLNNEDISNELSLFEQNGRDLLNALESMVAADKAVEQCYLRLGGLLDLLSDMMKADGTDHVYWYEAGNNRFALHKSPLDVAGPLSRFKAKIDAAWILTSATITVNQSFNHFQTQTGFNNAQTLFVDSPFNYRQQARLLLPEPGRLPEPNHHNYNIQLFQYLLPIIRTIQGGIFFLFTAKRNREAAKAFFEQAAIDRNLYVQSDSNSSQILEEFRNDGNGLLLGTYSFWEGVDVSGTGLSCVIIDRIPFLHPDDPIQKAKENHLKNQGKYPFKELQIPHATLTLKQGSGRLIRGETDHGLLILCDPRFKTKPYGQILLKSLPEIPQINSEDEAIGFMRLN